MVSIVQETGMQIWQNNYTTQIDKFEKTLTQLQEEYAVVSDSIKREGPRDNPLAGLKLQQLYERIQNFSKISDEYKLAAQSLPSMLYVIETGVPAAYAERPDKAMIIVSAGLLAFVFGCIVVLVNDRKTIG